VLKTTGWLLVYIYIDVSFLIFQMLLSFVKLFIAFFLLWLIVDLFILKAFVHSEAHYLHVLRAAVRNKA
jgi:high-affinity Fe2+/Pb2+ permease